MKLLIIFWNLLISYDLLVDVVFTRFYRRWKETESIEAQMLNFSLEESQCEHDWGILLSLASQPGKKCIATLLITRRNLLLMFC